MEIISFDDSSLDSMIRTSMKMQLNKMNLSTIGELQDEIQKISPSVIIIDWGDIEAEDYDYDDVYVDLNLIIDTLKSFSSKDIQKIRSKFEDYDDANEIQSVIDSILFLNSSVYEFASERNASEIKAKNEELGRCFDEEKGEKYVKDTIEQNIRMKKMWREFESNCEKCKNNVNNVVEEVVV
jgi:hypothetical protein